MFMAFMCVCVSLISFVSLDVLVVLYRSVNVCVFVLCFLLCCCPFI